MSTERKDEVKTTQSGSAKKGLRISWVNIGILCSALAIIVLIVTGSYSYFHLITANMQLTTLATQSKNQLQQLQSDVSAVQKNAEEEQQINQQLVEDIKNLKQAVHDFSQGKQDNQEKWLIMEAHYHVKLANDYLQFSRPILQAITLLKMAEQEMSGITNPRLAEIRKMVVADIANLQGTPQVDVASVYMKLMALDGQVEKMPLLTNQLNSQEQKPVVAADQKQTAWQRALHAGWQALQSIVVVHYNANGSTPLMVPGQQVFLYQNLHAVLGQAIWALLHEQPVIYQSSLQQAVIWVNRYFVADAPMTRAVLNDLMQLQKIDIHPPVPTIANTLQAFNGV